MSNPTTTIHNVETGEILEREMTDSEYASFLESKESESPAE